MYSIFAQEIFRYILLLCNSLKSFTQKELGFGKRFLQFLISNKKSDFHRNLKKLFSAEDALEANRINAFHFLAR